MQQVGISVRKYTNHTPGLYGSYCASKCLMRQVTAVQHLRTHSLPGCTKSSLNPNTHPAEAWASNAGTWAGPTPGASQTRADQTDQKHKQRAHPTTRRPTSVTCNHITRAPATQQHATQKLPRHMNKGTHSSPLPQADADPQGLPATHVHEHASRPAAVLAGLGSSSSQCSFFWPQLTAAAGYRGV